MTLHEKINRWLTDRMPPENRDENWTAARAGWGPTFALMWKRATEKRP